MAIASLCTRNDPARWSKPHVLRRWPISLTKTRASLPQAPHVSKATGKFNLLYLMVLADSHTISKSIDSDEKVDDNIFESIHDVDRPTIPKTRKDRQHKYKLYYSKDDDVVLQGVKETNSYSEQDKITEKINVKPVGKSTTEHAKRHKSPKRRVGSFWKKLRGKYKKKENNNHDPKDRRRRISNHTKESHNMDYLTPKPDSEKTIGMKKHRKSFSLRKPEHNVSKRDASGLFSTRPYSHTPQSYKLQMGIAPQVDNMLKSKSKMKAAPQHLTGVDTDSSTKASLRAQLDSLNSRLSKLKQSYGLVGNKIKNTGAAPENDADYYNPSSVNFQNHVETTEHDFAGTAHLDELLSSMKAKAADMMTVPTTRVTEVESRPATEAIVDVWHTDTLAGTPMTDLITVSANDIARKEKTTVANTGSYELNPQDSIISSNTESHSLAARSIKEDAMTIAMNVEDLLQKELKSLYNKVKHKVSNDFRKEVHTIKSTVKDRYEKFSSKLSSKCKSANVTKSSSQSVSSSPATHSRTCPCKPKLTKVKDKSTTASTTAPRPTTRTTAPRVKKKDEKVGDRKGDNFTSETPLVKQTYDDYMMLTLYEQMLAKTQEDNLRKMLGTPEFPIYAKNKREAVRLSKRNPETLADVKLSEVVRNLYDDGGNMPDYDYIDPAANVSSSGKSTTSSKNDNYNDVDYVIGDSSGSADYSVQGSMGPMQNKPQAKDTPPAHNAVADTENSAIVADSANSGNTASHTRYDALSNKISYNKFVNGYKHYLKFQQDLKNQNFSNLVKYQAHRHHSVDDIGKYILNKIPPIPTYNRKKRDVRFSDESDNNMDYQEITTKSDDSWFKKHFYLFIDNGPPKKYHTAETVELKPGTGDFKLFMTEPTEPTPKTGYKEEVFIKIDNSAPRKAKNTEEISLDDLSRILDSVKETGNINKKTQQNTQKDTYGPMDTYNATNDVPMPADSIIGKFLGGKRRHVSRKRPVTTIYFPTTNFMYAENTQARLKRSNTKENLESTLLPDYVTKNILAEKAITIDSKELYADTVHNSNKETNKYGYVDIDLVPRQTAIVKLRDSTKKSRFKNFFKKFHFKKDKSIKPKPKRSVYDYNFYSPNPRRERFNPIKKLKDIFRNKEVKENERDTVPPFRAYDYDVINAPMDSYKPRFEKPMSIAEMQKQIPNISDIYFEPPADRQTTKQKAVNDYKLDDKDQDLLYNYHPKPSITSEPKNGKQIANTAPDNLPATKATRPEAMSSTLMATALNKKPLRTLLRVPLCNVMTVNVKTMEPTKPTTTLIPTVETSSPMAIDDMSNVLDKIQKELRHDKDFPTTMYDPSIDLQTMKFDYKKNVLSPIREPEALLIKSKLTRIAKFPIRKRRLRTGDDSGLEDIDKDILDLDRPAILQYLHDLQSKNALPSDKRAVTGKPSRKPHHPQQSRIKEQDKSIYTDYFNDLLMWHNDILNLDTVPHPLWENILKTLQTDSSESYTTPDMRNLMVELNEMNDFLIGRLNKSAVTVFPNGSMEVKAKDRLDVRALNENHIDDDRVMIRSMAMDDNTIVTSKDMLIKGEAKYFQYNKPRSPEALGSSDFIMKLNKLNRIGDDKVDEKPLFKRKDTTESSTSVDGAGPAIIVDTTLMAYDDDVDSITKELEIKKMSRDAGPSSNITTVKDKTVQTSILKTNEAPVQYYTTPLPMKSHDFHKFLKEHAMDVDSVTAPIIELPTLIDNWTKHKQNKWGKPNGIIIATTAETATIPESWDTPPTCVAAENSEPTPPELKSSSQSSTSIEKDLTSTIESITKAVGKSVKFTNDPLKKPVTSIKSNKKNKVSGFSNDDWNEDFDRYKRFNAPKPPVTQEAKYYSMFKKKVKDKLFEKKSTEQQLVERAMTNTVSVDPQNKEVEITIINFDDIDKLTTGQPFDSFVTPKKDEMRTFTDLNEMVTPETTPKRKAMQKEDIHNGLLYKDIFKEQTSTPRVKEYSNTDLTKSTEYVDTLPSRDGPIATNNKLRFPFDKVPVYPNVFNKIPHGKHINNVPRRVHITSHHYKYDIFYDDIKKSGKHSGVEGCGTTKVPHIDFERNEIFTQASPHYDGSNTEIVKITDRAPGNRHRRRVRRTDVLHKNHKFFTFRGCKPKASGGLSEPTGYFEIPTMSVSPDDASDSISKVKEEPITETMDNTVTTDSMSKFEEEPITEGTENTGTADYISKLDEEPFSESMESTVATDSISKFEEEPISEAMENTATVPSNALSDIEDVVTLLDKQNGVTTSDIEDAVTLSVIKSEFFTSITVRDSIRRALTKKKTTVPKTNKAPVTSVSAETAVVFTKSRIDTRAPTTKKSSSHHRPVSRSLVYDLKKIKTSTSKSSLDKDKVEETTFPERDRHRRLFKFSVLQSRLKSFMKNFTKHANVTTLTVTKGTTTKNPEFKTKRTCFKYIPEPPSTGPDTTENKANYTEVTEDVSDEKEGFCITHRCKETTVASHPTTNSTAHAEGPTSTSTPAPSAATPVCEEHHYGDEPPTYHDEHAPSAPHHHQHHHHSSHHHDKNVSCQHRKPLPKEPQELFYFEPQTYDEQLYYEEPPLKFLPTTPPPCPEEEEEPNTHCDFKREILQSNTYTAKDVAALEVIVDLMKNTMNYDDNNIANGLRHSIVQSSVTRPVNSNCTNAIQVHIAIPYDFQTGKKRSPSGHDPVRVRKVFSAKMCTPVDLEYQVHSIEGTLAATSTKRRHSCFTSTDGLTPGMYLLIDKPRDGFALKPVLGQLNVSEIKSRQLPPGTTVSMTEAKSMDSRIETTSMKNLARVTLSKDFIAALNQQLLEIIENRSRINKEVDNKNNVRVARSVWRSRKLKEKKERKRRKKGAEKYVLKRRIDWEAVKKYFGHDRVCNCKCKSNTAMCRACAASDAVIDELIFEFDNIGQYMADHCTEIQTFFWMNPLGGQKLRDSVHKIDRSLSDYYKRVKGKCQGRLCKTFSTYIDKRTLVKTDKIKKAGDMPQLINDLATLADDLNKTIALNVCYNDKLKENGDKFIDLMYRCIRHKSFHKRSNSLDDISPKKMVKQVYSLDNINVNIICHPESTTTQDEQTIAAAAVTPQASLQRLTSDHLLDFDLEESRNKKQKGLNKLFPRRHKKSKLRSYFHFNKRSKTNFKRQVDNQVPKPLISDGGGSFWYDYLKSGTDEPRLARDSIKDTPRITVDVIQREVTAQNVLKLTAMAGNDDLGENTIYMAVQTSPERNPRDVETTTDCLSRNINQMLQLFGSLQDVEDMNNSSIPDQTTSLTKDSTVKKAGKDKKAENKPKKLSFADKVKQKMDKHLAKNKTTTHSTTTKKHTPKVKSTLEKEMEELTTIEYSIESLTQLTTSANPTTCDSNDNTVVITSNVTTTCTPTTNKSTVTVGLAAKTAKDAASTTVDLKSITPHGDKNSKTTLAAKEITTKFGFKNIIKAATVMFMKETSDTTLTTKTSELPATTTIKYSTEFTPVKTSTIDLVTGAQDQDYVIEENSLNVTQNPTILIINDYGSRVTNYTMNDEMKESYKNLLLSVIQFETNNLNDEWDRIAYGKTKHRDEADVKRSITTTPKVETTATTTSTPITTTTAKLALGDVGTFTELEADTTTEQPEGLFNKIASKMGIKKKVVKKPNIREVRKDRKRTSFIKNRKLRINSYRPEVTPAPVTSSKEACNTRRTTQPAKICDVQATYEHIQSLQKSTPPKVFEILMKNVSCYKYRNADAYFVIPYKTRRRTWDWIRNRRSLKHFHNKISDRDIETYIVDIGDDPNDFFETYVKGDNGIYKIVKRKKRRANLETLERGLRNIPTLVPTDDELFVMLGDSVTLDCGVDTPVRTCDGQFLWQTDRKRMLNLDNVEADGVTVTIHKVEPRNSGIYTCSLDHAVRKNVKLNVLTVPSFDVVFLPVYKTEDNCSYDDLIAIQRLGNLMSNETRCGKACSIRIDEPVCQKDRATNNTLVRATAVISMTPTEVNCSLQCKRDIVSSLVMLCATNAAILSSIKVIVSKDGVSENLTPWKNLVRPVVTHTLRKKDTNGHHEYHQLSSLMSPGKVDVVLICPAGYYLLSKYKLCSSCPPNTSSKAGDNTCRSCPRGTHSEPGASKCQLVKTHQRRYDWWWYPPCGYVVACCGVLFGCTACVLLSVIVHVVSRDAELREQAGDEDQKIPKPMPSVTMAYAHFPGARPLSPSRVILPRFFRPSLTSSRATDSQETKFELWKERNRPPPLPPIDFDP